VSDIRPSIIVSEREYAEIITAVARKDAEIARLNAAIDGVRQLCDHPGSVGKSSGSSIPNARYLAETILRQLEST
jgi:hypothetical protein